MSFSTTRATKVSGVENYRRFRIWRAKMRGGYDLGRTMIYATGGFAQADTSAGTLWMAISAVLALPIS